MFVCESLDACFFFHPLHASTDFVTQIELLLMYVAHDGNDHATYVNITANQFIFKLTGMTFLPATEYIYMSRVQ